MISAEEYVKTLGLDEDDVEGVQEELDVAISGWTEMIQEGVIDSIANSQEKLENLFAKIGTTYSDEIHGKELQAKADAQGGKLTKEIFADWYIRWVFNPEEDNEGDGDDDEVAVTGAANSRPAWVSSEPVEGVTWKCPSCCIVNKWSQYRCLACETKAPHATEEQASTSVFTFGSSTSGATFGSAPVTFGAAPATAPVTFGAAPVTFGAAAPVTFGAAAPVTFGSAPVTFGSGPVTFGAAPPSTSS